MSGILLSRRTLHILTLSHIPVSPLCTLSCSHFDGGDFFSIQIDGTKTWTMVDPVNSLYLYADHIYPPPGPAYGHQVFRFSGGVNTTRLPNIVETPTLQAEVRRSDILYIPQRWWHEVHSHEGRNIGLVLQTSFPDPTGMGQQPAIATVPWSPAFYSQNLLAFGAAWRTMGTTGLPESLQACLPNGSLETRFTDDQLAEMWWRGLARVAVEPAPDNSRG